MDVAPVHLKRGGLFIAAGIINMKEEAVKTAFEGCSQLEILGITRQGECVSVTARRK